MKDWSGKKLDGVGPVDNRPSTDKLHHCEKKIICDMWHVTCDMWHVTHDTWHVVTRDTWRVWGVNSLPSSYGLEEKESFEDIFYKGWPTKQLN